MAEGHGELYKFFFGRSATAPSTPTDPESMTSYHEIGGIPDAIALNLQRTMVNRFTRDSPGQTFRHPSRRTADISFPLNFDPSGNDAWTDLTGAYFSNTDGVAADGSLGYWAISNNSSGAWLAHGTGGVSGLPISLPVTAPMSVNVTLSVNGDPTLTTHA